MNLKLSPERSGAALAHQYLGVVRRLLFSADNVISAQRPSQPRRLWQWQFFFSGDGEQILRFGSRRRRSSLVLRNGAPAVPDALSLLSLRRRLELLSAPVSFLLLLAKFAFCLKQA